jgi:hypothetical protein
LRGRPSNRRIDPQDRAKVIAAYQAELMGFGPTFAADDQRQLESASDDN